MFKQRLEKVGAGSTESCGGEDLGGGVRFLPEDRRPRSPSPDEEENRLANPWEQRRTAFSLGEGELARRR